MTLQDFARQITTDYPKCKVCYIALMPIDGQYDLEVEISHDTIGGVYRTEEKVNSQGVREARKLADRLDVILTNMGIRVCKTREEWDKVK